jgi:uroporphyrinogen decarboxylase
LTIVNIYDRVASSDRRLVAPLAGYPGVRLIGRSVREAVNDPALQLEALLALEERLAPDVVFTLLDLTVEAEALGLEVDFFERKPPNLADQALPVLERFYELELPDPERAARMPVFLQVAEDLATEERSCGAFVTGPITLLAQLVGTEVMLDMVAAGDDMGDAIGYATSVVGQYAAALAARVDMVVVVDPAAEALTPSQYRDLYRPYISGLVGIIRSSGAVSVMHICGDVSNLLEEISLSGVEGVCLDSSMDLMREAEKLPSNLVLMGNIDPKRVIQRGTPEDVRWEVRRLLRHMDKVRNFILSTGCDVSHDTPMRNLEAMMEEARTWRSRSDLL